MDNANMLAYTTENASGVTETSMALYGGTICAQANNTLFENCTVQNSASDGAYFGAMLLGHTDGGVTIKNSLVTNCDFSRKWDDGGLFIGYSCGTTTLDGCTANDSTTGAVFIGTPNIGNHYLINCTTLNVKDVNGGMAPIILEIRDRITRDNNIKGRVFIEWTTDEAELADINAKTDMHDPDEKHDEDNPMPSRPGYNDDDYAVADVYTFTYADKMTSRCPKNYTTQKCYDKDGNVISNMLEVSYFDHYISENELKYQTADQGDGKHSLRLISECHTLVWDYVGYRVWVKTDNDQSIDDFIKETVYATNDKGTALYESGWDQRKTNVKTANLNESSRFVWHTLYYNGIKVEHDHADSYFFTRTITDIPDDVWNNATFVVQPYIIRVAESDEATNDVPNTSVKTNEEQDDDISFGAIYVINPSEGTSQTVTLFDSTINTSTQN
jgi:hypothetical protein